jgi:hypothetical protein
MSRKTLDSRFRGNDKFGSGSFNNRFVFPLRPLRLCGFAFISGFALDFKSLCKHHPGRGDIFHALFQFGATMLVRPERREEHQLAGFGFDFHVLV